MSLAKVNGDAISIGDFRARLREIQFDPKLVAEEEIISLKKTILNEMIEEKLIQQEGKKANLKVTPEEIQEAMNVEHLDEALAKQNVNKDAWSERMKQKLLAEKLFDFITKTATPPTEDEMTEIYQKNPELFHQQEQVQVLQIILQDRTQADEALKLITQGTDFSEVVKKFNAADSNPTGDVGYIPRGLLPENIEKKVFSLKVGAVSPVLESDSQYYIVKVLARKEERTLLWEEARQQIESMLFQKSKEKAYGQWLQEKIIQANIKRNYELLQENIHP